MKQVALRGRIITGVTAFLITAATVLGSTPAGAAYTALAPRHVAADCGQACGLPWGRGPTPPSPTV